MPEDKTFYITTPIRKAKLRCLARAALAVVLLVSLSLPASARPQPPRETLASLLQKMRAGFGPPTVRRAWRVQKTVYAVNYAGVVCTLTEYDEAGPIRTRQDLTAGTIHAISADDGVTAWEQTGNGPVRRESGPEAAEDHAFGFSPTDSDPTATGGRLTLRAGRDGGTGDYVLDYHSSTGVELAFFVDPHTYRVAKELKHKRHGVGQVTMEYLSYHRIMGELVPASVRITALGRTGTSQLVSAAPEARLDPSLFAPPAAARDFAFLTPSGAGPVTLPFDDSEGLLLVPVLVNGQQLQMALDSGASGSVISTDALHRCGLTTDASNAIEGIGGLRKSQMANQVTLELPGAVRLTGQTFYAVSFRPDQADLHDGLLGYDLFARFMVTIDYQKKTLTLSDPATTAPPRGTVLPLRLDLSSPDVMASVDGRPAASFTADTGYDKSVVLFRPYALAQRLVPKLGAFGEHGEQEAGLGGTVAGTITPGHRLALGGLILAQLPVVTLDTSEGLDGTGAGIIGDEALHKFVVTFDFAHDRLILQKPVGPDPNAGTGR